eukprot:scaffold2406_cov363-Prasinococcus_capsulatus_cf.AAC.4
MGAGPGGDSQPAYRPEAQRVALVGQARFPSRGRQQAGLPRAQRRHLVLQVKRAHEVAEAALQLGRRRSYLQALRNIRDVPGQQHQEDLHKLRLRASPDSAAAASTSAARIGGLAVGLCGGARRRTRAQPLGQDGPQAGEGGELHRCQRMGHVALARREDEVVVDSRAIRGIRIPVFAVAAHDPVRRAIVMPLGLAAVHIPLVAFLVVRRIQRLLVQLRSIRVLLDGRSIRTSTRLRSLEARNVAIDGPRVRKLRQMLRRGAHRDGAGLCAHSQGQHPKFRSASADAPRRPSRGASHDGSLATVPRSVTLASSGPDVRCCGCPALATAAVSWTPLRPCGWWLFLRMPLRGAAGPAAQASPSEPPLRRSRPCSSRSTALTVARFCAGGAASSASSRSMASTLALIAAH